ncbi:MAG: tRNA (adenosine(37)-N6)-threonylcarbamoyltransferase complex transferase subunit TsaD [Opitutales bacterium TMED158]|nr:MAG: tRNA (adenosine(37)-N6)-threonylcarbamoyltransferase complex transferase subunit TsaD [Opitutales bacterium TMED158]
MILGIESSCDESALAVLDRDQGLVGEWVSSQVSLHAEYGGVVPELASREHLANFGPLLEQAKRSVDLASIREIAVTSGPGLAGCLAMGLSVANALSIALGAPVYAANHLRAHAHSVFISEFHRSPSSFDANLLNALPHLSLVVSGGNTLLAYIDVDRNLVLLGQTIDDAAGEALDKGAKLLGLGYPGGPKLEAAAREGRFDAYEFPRGLLGKPNLDFSFSGLKTSLRYLLEGLSDEQLQAGFADVCASYQEAVVDILIRKAKRALEMTPYRSMGLSGGVSNNGLLRDRFVELANRMKVAPLLAERRHTGDNAGMIAFSHLFEGPSSCGDRIDIAPSATIETRLV